MSAWRYLTVHPEVSVLVCLCAVAVVATAEPRAQRLVQHLDALTSHPSRIVGSPGHDAASIYIGQQLRAMGLAHVTCVTTTVLVPEVEHATLRLPEGGEPIRLYPLWPNLVRLPSTGPDGILGPLVYAGASRPEDYNGLGVRGAVVLLDWDCDDRWLFAAALEARAVVFIEPETMTRSGAEAKLTRAPLSLPRFFIPRGQGLALASRCRAGEVPARIVCRMRWVSAVAPTWIAQVPGRDPTLAHEALLVQAHYDAMSVVPELAPGAEQACGMAALLALAERMSADPPRRTLVVVASSAQCLAFEGIIDLLGRAQYQQGRARSLQWPQLGIAFSRWVMFSLALSSGTNRLGLVFANRIEMFPSGLVTTRQNAVVPVCRGYGVAMEQWCAQRGVPVAVHFFNGVVPPRGRRIDERMPGGVPFGAEAVDLRGEIGFGLVTLDDTRPLLDTPHDRREHIRTDHLALQMDLCEALLRIAADAPALPGNTNPWPRDEFITVTGRVRTQAPLGSTADIPVPDALVVALRHPVHTIGGVRTDRMARSGSDGGYVLAGLETRQFGSPPPRVRLEAFSCDPRTGAITMATDLGQKAHGTLPVEFVPRVPRDQREVFVFPCVPIDLHDRFSRNELVPTWPSRVSLLDARTDTEPQSFGYFAQERNTPNPWNIIESLPEPCAVLFVPPRTPFKFVTYGILGHPHQLLVNMPLPGTHEEIEPRYALGRGLVPFPGLVIGDTPYRSARDMYVLARKRMDTFARYGIRNEHLEDMLHHGRALLHEAEQARAERLHARAAALAHAAWALLSKCYPVAKNTADDMVLAVMFYLAMLVPFAVFLERLVLGFTDIRRRLIAMAVVFLLFFVALRYVHPAFDIAVTPALILLAFVILVLSVGVMAIVLRKFQVQTRQMREELGEAHVADIGRLSAGMIAFSLGVSNLRNRPVRTFLTSATIVLLTFCVLSFTSVKSFLGFRKYVRSGPAAYTGLLLADLTGLSLPNDRMDLALSLVADVSGAIVAPRVWHWGKGARRESAESYIDVRVPASTCEPYSLVALLQVSAQERALTGPNRALIRGRWFSRDDRDALIVPAALARALSLADPEVTDVTVEIRGHLYRVVGIYDEARYAELRDLDGFPLAPLDRTAIGGAVDGLRDARLRGAGRAPVDLSALRHLAPDRFALVTCGEGFSPLPVTLGARGPDSILASIAIGLPDARTAERVVRDLVTRSAYTVYCGLDGRRYEYSAHGATALKGLGGLWAPIGITVLIVLNTMMGAVYERRREIGIFSSLGLAPSHIGFLFLAEACVIANLAIVLGYLIGQGAGKLITHYQLLEELTLNYSALSAVFTSVVIMVVVLLSSAYPSYLGSRMATPSVERSWRLPAPVGNRFVIDLPFTISRQEAEGLFRYLHEFLDAHVEYVMGTFYAEHLALSLDGEPRLECRVWLAPYDLGVSQHVQLVSVPSRIGGFLEFDLVLTRLEGDVQAWTRTNRIFLGELRKQLLIWRALPPARRRAYQTPEANGDC